MIAPPPAKDTRGTARIEEWPLASTFRIARGTKTEARVVVAELYDGEYQGRGECLPYARYGESPEQTLKVLLKRFAEIENPGHDADEPESTGCRSADNALDCALWDLQAQKMDRPVWELVGLDYPVPCTTAFTITIDEPVRMAEAAAINAHRPLLKIKLGGVDAERDGERMRSVREHAPTSDLIVDVNEGWTPEQLRRFAPVAADLGILMLEQPLPADDDDALMDFVSPVAIWADESVHGAEDLTALRQKYEVLNVKLDKTGGLTAAIRLLQEARSLEFEIMIGCMVATSLSMAPAMLLAGQASFVDLDGPLLLLDDRPGGLQYDGSTIIWPEDACWGVPRARGQR